MRLLLTAVLLSGLSFTASADVLTVPAPPSATPANLPARGTSMAEVKRRHGAPLRTSSAGGTGPRQPLIHRWDYERFSVFFEAQYVIDAVVPGEPPDIAHRESLIRE